MGRQILVDIGERYFIWTVFRCTRPYCFGTKNVDKFDFN